MKTKQIQQKVVLNSKIIIQVLVLLYAVIITTILVVKYL